MDIKKINDEAGKLIEYLKQTDLESYEKIAALKSAASTIENVIACEIYIETMRNIFNQSKPANQKLKLQ